MCKKLLTTLLICLTALIAAFSFTACGDESDGGTPTDVTGKTYIYSSCTVSGVSNEEKQFIVMIINSMMTGEVLTFNADGTLTATSDDFSKATYVQSGSKVTINVDGQNYSGIAKDKTFAMPSPFIGTVGSSSANLRVTLNFTLVESEDDLIVETSVSNKTYVYESVSFEFESWVNREITDKYDDRADALDVAYQGMTLTFGNKGDFTIKTNGAPDVHGTYRDVTALGVITLTTIAEGDAESLTFFGEVDGDTLVLQYEMTEGDGCKLMIITMSYSGSSDE